MSIFSSRNKKLLVLTPIALLSQLGCDREKGPDEIVVIPPGPAIILTPSPTATPTDPSKNDDDALALSASNILKENCSSCHNQEQRQGNFGIVEDATALIASGRYVLPGQPENSLLFNRLGNMPPGSPLSEEKKEVLSKWIKSLKQKKKFVKVNRADLAEVGAKYIEDKVPESRRRGIRFFSLHNMHNARAADSDMQTMKKGFLKVLNSLSQATKLAKPAPIDDSELLFPVDLPSIGFNAEEFDNIISEHYPYCPKTSSLRDSETRLRELTGSGSKCSVIRMDWFTATAALPKIYSRLLKQGPTRIALDEQLGVDINADINTVNNVIRSGFRNSGVSSQSRIIERHLQSNGLPYWISYDFAELDGKGNIFANPIGPRGIDLPRNGEVVSDKVFEHDGGEVIYQLPNGLFAYYLADAAGRQIDKGPTQIVKQQGAPEQFVSAIVNGVSCMSCHGSGLIHKADQIRDFVQRVDNQDQFSTEERDHVLRLYGPDTELQSLIAQDNEAYFDALKKLEIDYSKGDPVNDSFRIYNRGLTLNQVLAELDVEAGNSLFNIILNSDAVKFIWANLNDVGAFLSREEFNLGIKALSKFELTRFFEIPSGGDYLVTPNCMSKDLLFMNECFISDAIGGEERR